MEKIRIQTSQLPLASSLYLQGKKYSYVDSYQASLAHLQHPVQLTDIGNAFFSATPAWVGMLFALRNKLVSGIGLKTSSRSANTQDLIKNFRWQPGERLGLFKVFSSSEQEVVLGEDDKHLDFRVSLFIDAVAGQQERRLIISTTVVFNNWFGKLYFMPVKHFHRLIVPAMLRGIVRELKKKDQLLTIV